MFEAIGYSEGGPKEEYPREVCIITLFISVTLRTFSFSYLINVYTFHNGIIHVAGQLLKAIGLTARVDKLLLSFIHKLLLCCSQYIAERVNLKLKLLALTLVDDRKSKK